MAIRVVQVRYEPMNAGLGFAMLLPKRFQAVIVLNTNLKDKANVKLRRQTIRHEVAHVLFFEITESNKDWANETMQKMYQITAEFATKHKGYMSLYAAEHTIPWLMAAFVKLEQVKPAKPAVDILTRDQALEYVDTIKFAAAKDVSKVYLEETGKRLRHIMARETAERTLTQLQEITAEELYELMRKLIVHEIVAELAENGLNSAYKRKYYERVRMLLPKRLRKLIETTVY